jgi:hypothetical protein
LSTLIAEGFVKARPARNVIQPCPELTPPRRETHITLSARGRSVLDQRRIFAGQGEFVMSDDRNAQLVGMLKTMLSDQGLPAMVDDIVDPELHALAAGHRDEFDEARAECEAERSFR